MRFLSAISVYDACLEIIAIAVTILIVTACLATTWCVILRSIRDEYTKFNDRQAFEAYLELRNEQKKLRESQS